MEKTRQIELSPDETHRAQAIYGLIQRGVAEGKLLSRTVRDIAENLHTFTTYSFNEQIIACGALSLNETIGTIRSIYVKPAFRNQRLAATLTSRLIEQAREAGMKEVTLNTDTPGVFHSNGFDAADRPRGMTLIL